MHIADVADEVAASGGYMLVGWGVPKPPDDRRRAAAAARLADVAALIDEQTCEMRALARNADGSPIDASTCGFARDAVAEGLDAVVLVSGRLVAATIASHDVEALHAAIGAASAALASAEARRGTLSRWLAPASAEEIKAEGHRLLRAWPQHRRGNLAGLGAELGIFLQERRPACRALQQACWTLKLTRVHPPVIAEVMAAIDAAEAALQRRVRLPAELPDRITRGEAALRPKPRRPVPARERAEARA